MKGAIPHLFERLFEISWENNGDCHITMPLSLKTIEVQIKGTTEIREVYNTYVANFQLYDLHDLNDLLLLLVTCYGPCIILFPEKYTVKDHISNTKLEKGDHYYIQTRHKDFFSFYNLILRKL